ncbi:protein ABCI7, chloroplastic-like [Zingiber officinale]|uniref:protein ABCI7, chloroplastic-like n=1 Tax=Zingiber officinale TaxID=94328 RepID=UPI001C4C5A2A|nr:protein ABCI7, chloroplastic-like [Zingiber officinale]
MTCCSSSAPVAASAPPPLPLRSLLLRPGAASLILPVSRASRRLVPVRAALSDPFVLEIAEKFEDSLSSAAAAASPPPLQKLRDCSSQSLLSKRWPSNKDEPFRFTNLAFLKSSLLLPASSPIALPVETPLDSPSPHLLAVVDGRVAPSVSRLDALPTGVFVGSVSAIPPGPTLDRVVSALTGGFTDGDLFWDLNGVGAPDLAVIFVPAGVRVVDEPIHVQLCYSEGGDVGSECLPVSNPRVLVVAEKGAEVVIVEEHLGIEENAERCYWANSVMEISIGEGAKVVHSYLQKQSVNAAHIKWTSTRQEASSIYELIEVSTGGRLSRHNLHIQQLGPDTVSELAAFHISRNNQTQDLHSTLILDHPRGYSRQLHKCIVSHSSGQAVFDGNIRVNRFAQQTDAGQLTRTLLLAPHATANVKPNLQIIADDVKCSHGAAISDLEEDQLFYFQARGIDPKTARDALVFSFGAEVISRIPFEPIKKSVSSQLKHLLSTQ